MADRLVLNDGKTLGGPGASSYVVETETHYIYVTVGAKLRGRRIIPKERVKSVEYSFDRKPAEALRPGQWDDYYNVGVKLLSGADPMGRETGRRLILIAIKNSPGKYYVTGHVVLGDAEQDDAKRLRYYRRALLASPSLGEHLIEKCASPGEQAPRPWSRIAKILERCDKNDPVAAWPILEKLTPKEEKQIDAFLEIASVNSVTVQRLRGDVRKCISDTETLVEEHTCPKCRGSKKYTPTMIEKYTQTCAKCGGLGGWTEGMGVGGHFKRFKKCRKCGGDGKIRRSRKVQGAPRDCGKCKGTGKLTKQKIVKADGWRKIADFEIDEAMRKETSSIIDDAKRLATGDVEVSPTLFTEKLKTRNYREIDSVDYSKVVFRDLGWIAP